MNEKSRPICKGMVLERISEDLQHGRESADSNTDTAHDTYASQSFMGARSNHSRIDVFEVLHACGFGGSKGEPKDRYAICWRQKDGEVYGSARLFDRRVPRHNALGPSSASCGGK